MRLRTSLILPCLALLLTALAAGSDQKDKDTAQTAEPHYDTSSSIDMMMVVAEVREVPSGPLDGLHLLVRPESAKSSSETIDVYLAPDDFMKDFSCHFNKGDRIQVKGSKVKFNGASAVLAKEVRLDSDTVYLRDDHGVPYWKKS